MSTPLRYSVFFLCGAAIAAGASSIGGPAAAAAALASLLAVVALIHQRAPEAAPAPFRRPLMSGTVIDSEWSEPAPQRRAYTGITRRLRKDETR